MKIKMMTTAAGPFGCYSAGETYDVTETLALQMIRGDYAVSLEEFIESFETTEAKEENKEFGDIKKRGRPKKS